MKQPEFRFWHKEHKVMMIANQLEWQDRKLKFVMADHLHEAWCFKAEEIILMQWTGCQEAVPELSRVMPQRIYEGDILKLGFCGPDQEWCLHKVEWDNDRGRWIASDENGNWENLYDIASGSTIVGNIYANPELMK